MKILWYQQSEQGIKFIISEKNRLPKVEIIEIPDRAISIKGNIIHIAKLVRDTRKQQGMTQELLAGASGTGIRLIVDIEKGKKTCEIGKVLHILNMLGLQLYI